MELWNRLRYVLSPQFDLYEQVSKVVRGNVADIGFGTGFGSHLLTVNAHNVVGYEMDECGIRFAQKVFPIARLQFRYGDIQKGIDDDGYDWVVMIDVIEHIKNDKQALLNAKKMLGKSGALIVSTPNRLSRYRKADTHVREYSPKEFETVLKMAFANVSLRTYTLEPLASGYENPMIAVCRNEK
uniref:Putative methyltransferase n=1 Tax=viral metagenome TaxID=1070528 RepID=A0A6M3JE56_9ZZZZ